MADEEIYEDDYTDQSIPFLEKVTKKNNILPVWGNSRTMNLNGLVLENVIQSQYNKNVLSEYTLYQQVVDEAFYNVRHLEPWERGTRKTQGMTGMCGGVRGVGAGGIVSTAFCCLYKFFTLKLTRKQLVGLLNNCQSPYLRGLGFMYIRYTQPPADLWSWFEPYFEDDSEIDPRSGGGDGMTFGNMVRLMLTKLDWYGTLFPRIPVPIQKQIEENFAEKRRAVLESEGYRDNRLRDDRKRVGEDDRPEVPVKKVKTRCGHHLRHHHCRKHRKQCPHKAKEGRAEKERQEAAKEMEEVRLEAEKERENGEEEKTVDGSSTGAAIEDNGTGTSTTSEAS